MGARGWRGRDSWVLGLGLGPSSASDCHWLSLCEFCEAAQDDLYYLRVKYGKLDDLEICARVCHFGTLPARPALCSDLCVCTHDTPALSTLARH